MTGDQTRRDFRRYMELVDGPAKGRLMPIRLVTRYKREYRVNYVELPFGPLPDAVASSPPGAVAAHWGGWLVHTEGGWTVTWEGGVFRVCGLDGYVCESWTHYETAWGDVLLRARDRARWLLHRNVEPSRRGVRLDTGRGLRAAVSSTQGPAHPWVAQVGGFNAAYGIDRVFLPARLDWDGSAYRWWWTLSPGALYEGSLYEGLRHRRVFLRAVDGEAVEGL